MVFLSSFDNIHTIWTSPLLHASLYGPPGMNRDGFVLLGNVGAAPWALPLSCMRDMGSSSCVELLCMDVAEVAPGPYECRLKRGGVTVPILGYDPNIPPPLIASRARVDQTLSGLGPEQIHFKPIEFLSLKLSLLNQSRTYAGIRDCRGRICVEASSPPRRLPSSFYMCSTSAPSLLDSSPYTSVSSFFEWILAPSLLTKVSSKQHAPATLFGHPTLPRSQKPGSLPNFPCF
ncbi:hypothetical protein VNO77_23273 [Canavalia gladiata]|uniref:Uncharacterized protein n=1 Tax=Canavalia gladiata TaxID=3824 RepID=A0AAN9L489_CANGL